MYPTLVSVGKTIRHSHSSKMKQLRHHSNGTGNDPYRVRALTHQPEWVELRGVDLLRDLPDPELEGLARAGGRLSLKRGEAVLQRLSSRTVIAVISGGVRLYRPAASGRTVTLGAFRPGQLCNLGALYPSGSDEGYMVATAGSTLVYAIPSAALLAVASRSPELIAGLVCTLSGRLAAARDLIEDFALVDARERIVRAVLRAQASGRTALTHDELAGLVGMRREDVTKVLHDLERIGIVRLVPTSHGIKVVTS